MSSVVAFRVFNYVLFRLSLYDRRSCRRCFDLETTSGEKQTYWLLAIRAARRAHRLTRRCNRDERTTGTISEDEEQSLALSEDEEQSQGSIEVPQNEVVKILEIHSPPRVRRISEGWNLDDEDDDELDNTFVQDPPPRVRRCRYRKP